MNPLKFFAACILTAVSLSAAGVAPAAPMADGVVDLPEFVVTDTRILPKPESWRYAEIPGFEILSTVSERETRRFVRDFQLLQQVIELLWPALTRGTPTIPTMVILCGRGRVFGSFIPSEQADEKDYATSIFVRDQERAAIVVDFVGERLLLEGRDAPSEATEEPAFMAENDPYREFYLQYFRSLIQRVAPHSPPWLEEGLVQLLATVDYSKKHVSFARIGNGFGGVGRNDFNEQLARQALLKFDQLFAAERPTLREAPQYSMQCFAFVHLCLYGMNGRYQKQFLRLVERAMTEPITESVFQECFGMTSKKMLIELRGHAQYTHHKSIEFRARKGSQGFEDVQAFDLRSATPAEIGRIKGETYRLGGHAEKAKDELIAPYIRGERDPKLLAALGLYERSLGQDERARKFLEAAAKAKAVRPQAYLELARLRYAEAMAAPAGADGQLSGAQAEAVLEALHTARAQPPPLFDVYEMIAQVWTEAGVNVSREELSILYEGVNRFPTRLRLLYLTAALSLQHGAPAGAAVLIERGLMLSPKEEGRRRFEELKAELPPAASVSAVTP